PKERRRLVNAHEPSAKLSARKFAVQDNAVQHVDIGEHAEMSANDIIHATKPEDRQPSLTKKAKLQLKKELFLQRLESGNGPYSKSHARRLKRKSREKIAGGLDDLRTAITSVEEAIPVAVQNSVQEISEDISASNPPSRVKPKPGQIGEGKAAPLSKTQRKRALQVEQIRHPLILSNPDYVSNPFETIRKHAQNTLVKRQDSV
ncbi:hypothetical protein GLOTRDRAFT_31341, partial [Gloeophyllum trabeum ATCC 11539]